MVAIKPAMADHKPLIANLIQLYLYDMTDTMPFPVGADGRFGYDLLDRFWRFPYLIYAGEEIAGFALVIDQCPLTAIEPCWFMAEFFVLKAYRRAGTGTLAVSDILARDPGTWHIAAPLANLTAQRFWGQGAGGPITRGLGYRPRGRCLATERIQRLTRNRACGVGGKAARVGGCRVE